MPIYEYRCTECEERFEIEQSIKEDSLTSLPGDDHEHTLKKVFSPVGISFKGGGFYKNDARKSSSSSSSSSTTPGTDATPAKSDTKTETKSETKSETKASPSETKSSAPSSKD